MADNRKTFRKETQCSYSGDSGCNNQQGRNTEKEESDMAKEAFDKDSKDTNSDESVAVSDEEAGSDKDADVSDKRAASEKDDGIPDEEDAGNEKKETETREESSDTKYMRLMADFQNFKRRTEKEKSDIYAYANEQIALELLEVIDNFERALDHESTDKAYAEGMELILKQLIEVLKKSGIEEIKTLGEEFDPNFHNAVMMEDNPDFESGKVTEVLQKGYTLNSKVIRPSMVKVNN